MSIAPTYIERSEEAIISKIYLIRGQKVMVDRDLAALYGVENKQLKRQVRRNISRFPNDFMFGVAILSSVLNSERAIKVNVQIMRIYSKMREMLMTNQEILLRLESLEGKITKNDTDIQLIFKYLKQLLTPPEQAKRSRIGFKRQDEEDQP